jgi:hypothetical protein
MSTNLLPVRTLDKENSVPAFFSNEVTAGTGAQRNAGYLAIKDVSSPSISFRKHLKTFSSRTENTWVRSNRCQEVVA